ncbi:hypothetical protein [Streptomyces subrutilus]|nr:hypothetical protein OG479_32885 [Streptomyces subrutilus]
MQDYTPAETEPDYTPRPNTIADAPATVDACRQDYAAAAAVRATLAKQA